MKSIKYILALFIFATVSMTYGQTCEKESSMCSKNMTHEYISDGQNYTVLLDGDQVAEFDITMFGGSTYRISGCSGDNPGNLLFKLKDTEGNVLFDNNEYSNAPYWDFTLDSTIDCVVEAQLDKNKMESGCGVLLIAFKR